MDLKSANSALETPAAVLEHRPDHVALKSQAKEALEDIAFGSYPFDTVKVRLQSSRTYSGPLDCFRASVAQDGFWSLYRGISAPLLGAAVETSSLFFSVRFMLSVTNQYRLAQTALSLTVYEGADSLPFGALLLSGAASGAFTSTLLTPIELIKCKMQVPLQKGTAVIQKPRPLTLIASIFKHQGLRGFWHGQTGTLIRETGGSAAWFGSFEGISILFKQSRSDSVEAATPLPISQQLMAGAAAGMTYNFICYPADTIKSIMQTEDVSQAGKRLSFWTVGKHLWREQGVRGMYRGCGITVGRAAPSSAVIFTIYEALKNAFA